MTCILKKNHVSVDRVHPGSLLAFNKLNSSVEFLTLTIFGNDTSPFIIFVSRTVVI